MAVPYISRRLSKIAKWTDFEDNLFALIIQSVLQFDR